MKRSLALPVTTRGMRIPEVTAVSLHFSLSGFSREKFWTRTIDYPRTNWQVKIEARGAKPREDEGVRGGGAEPSPHIQRRSRSDGYDERSLTSRCCRGGGGGANDRLSEALHLFELGTALQQ